LCTRLGFINDLNTLEDKRTVTPPQGVVSKTQIMHNPQIYKIRTKHQFKAIIIQENNPNN
jgi:hypothetical protein